ncbi:MAG TPA: GGDEF domain-containing protein [Syntrophobacteraceae bacterium]|nr:GGDEF domain-containing protein [Syntrophobacteraceae bacterium]
MGPLEILSQALIDTLRELSAAKRPITAAVLRDAFCAREDILPLLRPESAIHGAEGSPAPGNKPARVSLPRLESNEIVAGFQHILLKLLDSLGPAKTGFSESRFCELQKEIKECQSLSPMSLLGEQVGKILSESIDQTIERMEYSNSFLVELGKDLSRMEDHLSAYQNYKLETRQTDSEFHNNLLLQTDELHQAFTSDNTQQHIYKLILSRLKAISQAIEKKEQSDTIRLQEENDRIASLQRNLNTYNKEILQVTKLAESLEKVVLLDELTNINNRRAYDIEISECLSRYHRTGEKFSLILIDIDHFKKINDEYGHAVGDKCLKEIAQLIKSSLRQTDFLARYGGEELIAILYGSNSANAMSVAEKMRCTIEETRFHYLDRVIRVTISLGVTEVLPDDTDPGIAFDRVDRAMYTAKNEGRNRISEATDMPLQQ